MRCGPGSPTGPRTAAISAFADHDDLCNVTLAILLNYVPASSARSSAESDGPRSYRKGRLISARRRSNRRSSELSGGNQQKVMLANGEPSRACSSSTSRRAASTSAPRRRSTASSTSSPTRGLAISYLVRAARSAGDGRPHSSDARGPTDGQLRARGSDRKAVMTCRDGTGCCRMSTIKTVLPPGANPRTEFAADYRAGNLCSEGGHNGQATSARCTFNRIATSVAIITVVAVGQILVVLTRNIDLLVGSIVGLLVLTL